MQIRIENITSLYHDEESGVNRDLELRIDGDVLHLDIEDRGEHNNFGATVSLDREQVKILRDSLDLILKNKLLD